MSRLVRAVLAGAAAVASLWTPVGAQEAVYGPSVPREAALVRVANLDSGAPSDTIDVGAIRFRSVPALSVTAYRPVDPGIYLIGRRGAQAEFLPESQRFYTIIVRAGETPVVIPDETHRDPSRAQLVLYNFVDVPTALVALEPAAPVIDHAPPGGSATRVVNAVTVSLAIATDRRRLFDDAVELERGQSYSFFAAPGGAFAAPATVEPR